MDDIDIKNKLTPEEYDVLHNAATERPFTGELLNNKEDGVYACKACGAVLFSSDTKFDSGSGWPSFFDVAKTGVVKLVDDHSYGMFRTEVKCGNCDSHLGHLFEDGPNPTGQRYCINSLALNFEKKENNEQS